MLVFKALYIDNELLGTGYTGYKIDSSLLTNTTKLISQVKKLGLLPLSVKPKLDTIEGYQCLVSKDKIMLVFKPN